VVGLTLTASQHHRIGYPPSRECIRIQKWPDEETALAYERYLIDFYKCLGVSLENSSVGRWPYGQHPAHEFDAERSVVVRIQKMKEKGVSSYAIARTLNTEGTRTRYSKEFTTKGIQNILHRHNA
jgi:hypothetical protein